VRKTLLALALLLPLAASAGVTRSRPASPVSLFSRSAALAAIFLGGAKLDRPVTVSRVQGIVINGGSSGGGAGNTVITFTDGTNTCTATIACSASSAAAGTFLAATVANGAGTGCQYAAEATITASVTTAGCTTTQPTLNLNAFGLPR
jgi:hypothetical protein